MTPESRPPIRTSKKKVMTRPYPRRPRQACPGVLESGGGDPVTSAERRWVPACAGTTPVLRGRARSSGDPQVRIDDFLIPAHLVRRPVADLAAVVEHDHAVADVHHDA